MPTAASAIIADVRDLISDSTSPYRWDDSTLLTWLNEGAASLFQMHPEFFYETEIVTDPPTAMANTAEALTVAVLGRKILVNYTAYRALLRDNEDPETMQMTQRFLELYSLGV